MVEQDVANKGDQVFNKPLTVLALPQDFRHRRQRLSTVALGHLQEVLLEQLLGHTTGHQQGIFEGQLVVTKGQGLIKNAQSIPHAPFRRISNHPQRLFIIGQILLVQDKLHPLKRILGTDAVKIKPLHPGQDRQRNLVGFGRRQNKDYVGRRFFQCLQQGIEGPRRQHMHFVNNVDLVISLGGRVLSLITNVADFFDPVVGSRVNFDYVAKLAGCNGLTSRAFVAWLTIRLVMAINRLGKNLGGRGFPGPTGPRKEVGVADLVGNNGIF